jgi:hypothetical protein
MKGLCSINSVAVARCAASAESSGEIPPPVTAQAGTSQSVVHPDSVCAERPGRGQVALGKPGCLHLPCLHAHSV